MEISYIGHSCFKLRGKKASVVTDPYDPKATGFVLPNLSADIVTISHQHADHNAATKVSGTARRNEPYVISAPGEYEVAGVGVFGWGSYHDSNKGTDRGKNTIYSIHIDGVRVIHLGDLGHTLDEELVGNLGIADVLLLPVGGSFTVDASEAAEIVAAIQPSYIIPMHYKTDKHNDTFINVDPLDTFLKEIGGTSKEMDTFNVTEGASLDEAELIVLKPKAV